MVNTTFTLYINSYTAYQQIWKFLYFVYATAFQQKSGRKLRVWDSSVKQSPVESRFAFEQRV